MHWRKKAQLIRAARRRKSMRADLTPEERERRRIDDAIRRLSGNAIKCLLCEEYMFGPAEYQVHRETCNEQTKPERAAEVRAEMPWFKAKPVPRR